MVIRRFFLPAMLCALFFKPAAAQENNFLLETFSLPEKVYLGQAFEVKVRLLNNLPVYSLYALPVNWDNVDVYPQESPRVYTMRRNGRDYAVSEILMKMVIKSVGKQEFAQLCFEAVVPDHIISGHPDFGAEFMPTPQEAFKNVIFSPETNTVVACSASFNVESLPLPVVKGKHIFPATQVELSEGIQPQSDTVQVGKPVKRSIVLKAKGTSTAFLPDLEQPQLPGVKQYAGKLEHQMLTKGDGLTAIVRKTVVFIPQKEGELTLPAVYADWFNPASNRLERAYLPEHKIRVLKQTKPVRIETLDASAQTPPDSDNALKDGLDAFNAFVDRLAASVFAKVLSLVFLKFLLCCAAIVGGAFVLYPVLKRRYAERRLVAQIHQACQSEQPDLIEKSLINWARHKFPDKRILTLFNVISLFDPHDAELRGALDELKWRIYGIGRASPRRKTGAAIWKAFQKSAFASEGKRKKDPLLENLYPDL